MIDAAELFARHLDLAPLRGRQRGMVRCRFHEDRTASLSIDTTRGVFNCFGCGAAGGVYKFAELVGERTSQGPHATPGPSQSPLARMRPSWLKASEPGVFVCPRSGLPLIT